MRRFINVTEMFARAERHPVRFLVNGCIEFRCSLILSNMSLAKFCENSRGVRYQKMRGEAYNYNKLRTAATPMTEQEYLQTCNTEQLAEEIYECVMTHPWHISKEVILEWLKQPHQKE